MQGIAPFGDELAVLTAAPAPVVAYGPSALGAPLDTAAFYPSLPGTLLDSSKDGVNPSQPGLEVRYDGYLVQQAQACAAEPTLPGYV